MASKNRDTLHMYLDAAERGDWDGMRRCIGGSYTFIDHTTDVVARTPEEMQIAGEEALAWSDLRYENPQVHETTDGTLIVQATLTRTLTGQWRGVEPTGQRVSSQACVIVRFDDNGAVVSEEVYEDGLSVMRQLGALT
jgi:ketosteroid isomerase-like protein